MPGRRVIITKIDGAIADTGRRSRAAFREVYGKAKGIDIAKALRGMSPMLTEEQARQYNSIFMSDKYMSLDRPRPNSSRVLKKLNRKGFVITYLSIRDSAMRASTMEWLSKHKFPLPDNDTVFLLMKDSFYSDSDFLDKRLAEIKELGEVSVGIVNSLDDIINFANHGVRPVILENHRDPDKQLNVSVEKTTIVKNWKDIESIVEGRTEQAAEKAPEQPEQKKEEEIPEKKEDAEQHDAVSESQVIAPENTEQSSSENKSESEPETDNK